MKRIITAAVSLLLIILTAFSASAASTRHKIDGLEFYLDSDYKIYTADDLLPGSSVDGLLFFAISGDRDHQIQARRTKTEFSTQIGSFSGLDDATIKPAGDKLFPDGYTTVTVGKVTYLKTTGDADGEHSTVYVTVSDGELYTFVYFGKDPSRIGEFLASVSIPGTSSGSHLKVYMIVIFAVLIALDIAFIVFLVLSFVNDHKRRKMERDKNIVSQYIKIKRRKY